jgi:hypothetical protein
VQNPSSELTSIITGLQIPVIDFEGLESGPRLEVENEIRKASETWFFFFFQIFNQKIGSDVSQCEKIPPVTAGSEDGAIHA